MCNGGAVLCCVCFGVVCVALLGMCISSGYPKLDFDVRFDPIEHI